MSNLIMGRVFKTSKTKSNDRLMMVSIADNADDYGYAWPGMKLLAAKMGNDNRNTAAVRIDVLSQTNELGVYPQKGASHHYLVFTGMSRSEVKTAIRRLAKKLKVSTRDLSKLRRAFQKDAADRIADRRSKKRKGGDTPSIQPLHDTPTIQGGDTPDDQGVTPRTIHEPSLTLIKPSSGVAPLTGQDDEVVIHRNIFKLLETIWGQMVSGIYEAEQWMDLEKDYPLDWIEDAMKVAIDNGGGTRRNIKYVRTTLQGWKDRGKDAPKVTPPKDDPLANTKGIVAFPVPPVPAAPSDPLATAKGLEHVQQRKSA
jgi:hypothetical protein